MPFSKLAIQATMLATLSAMSAGCCMPCGSAPSAACNRCGGDHAYSVHAAEGPQDPMALGRFHAVPTRNVFGLDDSAAIMASHVEDEPRHGVPTWGTPPEEPAHFHPPSKQQTGHAGHQDSQPRLSAATKDSRRRKMPPNAIRLADWAPPTTHSKRANPGRTDRTRPVSSMKESASTTPAASPFDAIPQNDLRSVSRIKGVSGKKPVWKPAR